MRTRSKSHECEKPFSEKGFSLIELIVTVAIIAILVGLMLPAIQKVRLSARRTQSANNLKQMTLAIHDWNAEHGFLPPMLGWDNSTNTPVTGGANGTVFFLILPYLDQNNLYQKMFGTLDRGCFASGPMQSVGVAAYRANRLSSSLSISSPKQFLSPLDKSTSLNPNSTHQTALTTATSYLANSDLLNKRIGIEKVTNGSSNTILLTEGLQSCTGSVWDPMNFTDPGNVSISTTTWYGQPGNPSFTYTTTSTTKGTTNSWRFTRTNNWAVGSEAYGASDYYYGGTSAIMTNLSVMDYTDPTNPKSVLMDLQATSPCMYQPTTTGNVKGNIPAFFKVDPYYEPWNHFTAAYTTYNHTSTYTYNSTKNNYAVKSTNSTSMTPAQVTPFGAPMRATYQDGRSWYVNPALAPAPAPPSDCLPFGAQSHYGSLFVAMLDGSVHSVGPDVSPDSFNAAISPFTDGTPVGPDFFE